jgi:hypothetical protein
MKKYFSIFLVTLLVAAVSSCSSNSGFKAGDVFTHTSAPINDDYPNPVKMLLIFQDNNDVILGFESSDRINFPVGFGKFDPESGNISFSSTEDRNRNVSFFYSGDINIKIVRSAADEIKVSTDNPEIGAFLEDGVMKRGSSIELSDKLVGSTWGDDEGYTVKFTTPTTAFMSGGDYVGYMLVGNSIAVKTGDNLSDETVIGTLSADGQSMRVRRSGLAPSTFEYIEIRKLSGN